MIRGLDALQSVLDEAGSDLDDLELSLRHLQDALASLQNRLDEAHRAVDDLEVEDLDEGAFA